MQAYEKRLLVAGLGDCQYERIANARIIQRQGSS